MSAPQANSNTKKGITLIIASAVSGYLLYALQFNVGQSVRHSPSSSGKGVVPDFHLNGIQTESFDLSDKPAKVTILHFWASWCGVCMSEMPQLVEFVSEYGKKGVQVFGVNLDDRPDVVVPRVVAQLGLNFPNFSDKGNTISSHFRVSGIPVTVIYNQNRQILAVHTGAVEWAQARMIRRIESWLKSSE